MQRDPIHDPDEEQQQEYPRDVGRQMRIGPGGEIEPPEPEDPAEAPPHGPRLPARGRRRARPKTDLRPHDRGYDVD